MASPHPDSGDWRLDLIFKGAYYLGRLLTGWRKSWTVSLAGFALMLFGILCLCLSALVANPASWWQGTLDAFGVGFVVGGLVDVMAIFALTGVLERQKEREKNANQKARAILEEKHVPHTSSLYRQWLQAKELLDTNWGFLDREVRERLLDFIEEASDGLTDDDDQGPPLPPGIYHFRWHQDE
jgi:hypothetical protein